MPIYEYVCEDCGTFTNICSIVDRKKSKPCPECSKKSKYKLSAPSFILEGITGDFPTAAARWAKNHESQGK